MTKNQSSLSVVMMGASGAVGGQALASLLTMPEVNHLTLLGRSSISDIQNEKVRQHSINIFEVSSYENHLSDHQVAICALGVGQPSKMSREDFVKIDKDAVLDFAKACKVAGVQHFELLASVGTNAKSSSFYLRTKGELIEGLKELQFEHLSIFEPSMILTPTNRYGFSQALTLFIWPLLKPLLIGGLRKYRGIKVNQLGKSMAMNVLKKKNGTEHLQWNDFMKF